MPYAFDIDPTLPLNTDAVSLGALDFRDLKSALIERLETVFTDIDLDPLVFRAGLAIPSVALDAPVVTGGITITGGITADTGDFSGRVTIAASVNGGAHLRITEGVAPGAPADGDVWTTVAGIFVQIAGVTQHLAPLASPHFTGLVVDSGGLTITLGNLDGVTASFSGAVTGGTYNGQTISAAAAFTGTLHVVGAVTLDTGLADSNLAQIATAGKVANSATTATSANTASAIVARSAGGTFSATTITSDLIGNVSGNVLGNLTGNVNGDVTGNVSGTSLNVTGTVLETHGGTGQAAYATGDILYASAANTLSRRAAGANGTLLSLVAGVPNWIPGLGTLTGTQSTPSGVATMLFALAVTGTWLLYADFDDGGGHAGTATWILSRSVSGVHLTPNRLLTANTAMTLAWSGDNVQVTQAGGATVDVNWSYIKLL